MTFNSPLKFLIILKLNWFKGGGRGGKKTIFPPKSYDPVLEMFPFHSHQDQLKESIVDIGFTIFLLILLPMPKITAACLQDRTIHKLPFIYSNSPMNTLTTASSGHPYYTVRALSPEYLPVELPHVNLDHIPQPPPPTISDSKALLESGSSHISLFRQRPPSK